MDLKGHKIDPQKQRFPRQKLIFFIEPFNERREVFMEEESGLILLSLLREWIVEQVSICEDVLLLDLVHKILLNG